MALTSGTKLGPYEIQSPLGEGGMGEVYRARDTRLDRSVAIKVLASHLSSSPELKQRMEREAKAISALNHPHICHLYDVGSQDGTEYLVMELLEGETLSQRLAKGSMPISEVLRIGIAVAEALEAAHRQGIVHRDLKPGNAEKRSRNTSTQQTTRSSWRRQASSADKVKLPSLYHRFVIAWHSPHGFFETGLLGCPPEKKAAKLADSNEQDTFSVPGAAGCSLLSRIHAPCWRG